MPRPGAHRSVRASPHQEAMGLGQKVKILPWVAERSAPAAREAALEARRARPSCSRGLELLRTTEAARPSSPSLSSVQAMSCGAAPWGAELPSFS